MGRRTTSDTVKPITKEECGVSVHVIHCLEFLFWNYAMQSKVGGTDREFQIHYYVNKLSTLDFGVHCKTLQKN